MSVPAQVLEQVEAANRLHQEVYGGKGEAEGGSPAEQTPAESAPTETANDEQNIAPAPAPQEQSGTVSPTNETFEQKYKTLQGMYSAEITPLRRQNNELNKRIQQLENLLATAANHQVAASAPPVSKLVTEKEVADYGDSLEVMRKVSREELSPVVQRLVQIETMLNNMQANVVPQVQAVVQQQQLTAEERFYNAVLARVPNAREVYADPRFQEWLQERAPYTSYARYLYMEEAYKQFDANRAAEFFEGWLRETGQTAIAQPNARSAASELEKQVAPSRSKNSAPVRTAKEGKSFTREEVATFYKDCTLGKYKNKESERASIERDIFAAQREGRIT